MVVGPVPRLLLVLLGLAPCVRVGAPARRTPVLRGLRAGWGGGGEAAHSSCLCGFEEVSAIKAFLRKFCNLQTRDQQEPGASRSVSWHWGAVPPPHSLLCVLPPVRGGLRCVCRGFPVGEDRQALQPPPGRDLRADQVRTQAVGVARAGDTEGRSCWRAGRSWRVQWPVRGTETLLGGVGFGQLPSF